MTTNGHVSLSPEEIEQIMDVYCDFISDTKTKLQPVLQDCRTVSAREFDILTLQIIPHTFRLKSGSSPNDMREREEEVTHLMMWNYRRFAELINKRASDLKIIPRQLFERALGVLIKREPSAQAKFLDTLFGEQFVLKNIGDRKIIYSFSKRHKPDSSDDPEELKSIPEFVTQV